MLSGVIVGALRTTNGPSARTEWAWISRAASSLPAPGGPEMSTRELVGPSRSMTRCRLAIAAELPIMRLAAPARARSSLTSRLSREVSSARSATRISRSALNGFSMKS